MDLRGLTRRIVLGVFLGNLMFGLLAWFVVSIHLDEAERSVLHSQHAALCAEAAGTDDPCKDDLLK